MSTNSSCLLHPEMDTSKKIPIKKCLHEIITIAEAHRNDENAEWVRDIIYFAEHAGGQLINIEEALKGK
jgi:hypothetical protein